MKRKIKSSSLLSAVSLIVAGLALPLVALAAPVITKYPTGGLASGSGPETLLDVAGTPDHIWFSENGSGKVGVLDTSNPTAAPVEVSLGASSQPNGLALGGSTVYVAAFGNNTIVPIDTTTNTAGTPIAVGSSGSTGHVATACMGGSEPVGVAVDTSVANGPIWFTEFGAADSVTSSSGCIGVLTNSGSGYSLTDEYVLPAGFSSPGKMIYADHQIFITASNSTTGGLLEIPQTQADSPPACTGACTTTPVQSVGTGFTASTNMQGLAYDPTQNLVYFADNQNNKIGVIGAGALGTVCYYPVPTASSGLDDLVLGPDGKIWFTESSANKIGSIASGGITCAGTITDPYVSDAGATVSGPNGIAATGTGSSDVLVWFSENGGNTIDQLNLAGSSGGPTGGGPSGGGGGGSGSSSGSGSGGSGTTAAPKTPNTGLAALVANPLAVLFSSAAAACFLVAIVYRLKPVKR